MYLREDGIEVWSPTQIGAGLQEEIALLSGLPLKQVRVHMTLCGGSFGRRYQWDFPAEAWQVAQEMKQPVQLLWTREDDMQHDFYASTLTIACRVAWTPKTISWHGYTAWFLRPFARSSKRQKNCRTRSTSRHKSWAAPMFSPTVRRMSVWSMFPYTLPSLEPGGGPWNIHLMASRQSALWTNWHTPPAAIRMSFE